MRVSPQATREGLTPSALILLMELRCFPTPSIDSPARHQAIADFRRLGFLYEDSLKLTMRGIAHVEALCKLPLPTFGREAAMTNRFLSQSIDTSVPMLAPDAFGLSLDVQKPRKLRYAIEAIFLALTLSQQERILEHLGWQRAPGGLYGFFTAQEGAQEPQGATIARPEPHDIEARLKLLGEMIVDEATAAGIYSPEGPGADRKPAQLVRDLGDELANLRMAAQVTETAIASEWEGMKRLATAHGLNAVIVANAGVFTLTRAAAPGEREIRIAEHPTLSGLRKGFDAWLAKELLA